MLSGLVANPVANKWRMPSLAHTRARWLPLTASWTKSADRAIRGVMPPRVQPIIPTWRKEPFDDPDWLFEFKYDGFRGLCYLEQGGCRFVSRNGNVLSDSRLTAKQERTMPQIEAL
jgi:ATP-dependent DNA ligase